MSDPARAMTREPTSSQPARGASREHAAAELYGAGESFHECLNRLLFRSQLSQNALSRRSQLDISYVSRLVNRPCDPLNPRPDDSYRVRWPSRDTVIRLAIAMGLDVMDTNDLPQAAGYVTLIH